MKQIDQLTVHVLVDNVSDMLSSRPDHITPELRVLMAAGMSEMAGQALCSAHHGLALAVTARIGDREHTVLFDAGPEPTVLERNATRMNFDFGRVEAIVLSHGHFDHAEGLLLALQLIRRQNPQARIPLHLHPGVFAKRAVRLANGDILPLQSLPSPQNLQDNGATIISSSEAEFILDDLFYVSGEIPRTSFERGLPSHLRQNENGEWEPDPLITDERFLAAHVAGKGIVILTGCSHAGILNICTHAREMFPGVPLYALVGGLHLVYPNEDIIPETIAELRQFNLKFIIPGHCTGWRALHALVREFGEGVVDPLAVGSIQTF